MVDWKKNRIKRMKTDQKALFQLIASMVIFGTIGIFRRGIIYSSALIAAVRGIAGSLFLMLVIRIRYGGMDHTAIRRNWKLLILSGIAMGFNWILLFDAYNYTTVTIATLCYYMEPLILIIASPFLLHEKLTLRKSGSVIAALLGMCMVSGVIGGNMPSGNHLKGILLGLGAAVLYACVVLMNKKIHDISAYDKTAFQLMTAGLIMIPFLLLTENPASFVFDSKSIVLLVIVAIVHTGFAYAMYFGSMVNLSAQTIAVFSYADPVTAVILSALFLKEPMNVWQILGAILIIGASLFSQWEPHKKQKSA